jgi:hypothetical protein
VRLGEWNWICGRKTRGNETKDRRNYSMTEHRVERVGIGRDISGTRLWTLVELEMGTWREARKKLRRM